MTHVKKRVITPNCQDCMYMSMLSQSGSGNISHPSCTLKRCPYDRLGIDGKLCFTEADIFLGMHYFFTDKIFYGILTGEWL